ncbi:MAG: DUF1446 domain-containing protein, partial [Cyclobacteriaceae bacterium]|nr:DUF1446 domain-containing protein [Cyclobacteriaceae bacterium SS2]
AKALQALLAKHGFKKKVIAVSGDNIITRVPELRQIGNTFSNLETGEGFEEMSGGLRTANAYTSSEGIIKALEKGADIVICGRASDSALAIGPIKYEMGWLSDQWDLMASAMLAGHLIECGTQVTGGNFTDWKSIKDWSHMGYPIIEMFEDGYFIVTKAAGTGGLINTWTVKEQLVYEIADPENYIGPEVIADLTTLEVSGIAMDQVMVKGVTGKPAPDTWKVSMAFHDGYKASGHVVVGGDQAHQKAEVLKEIFWQRLPKFDKTSSNLIGSDALGDALKNPDPKEILLQFTAFDHNQEKLQKFSKELAGLILSGPQGVAAYGARPKVQEVMAYWPTLVNKKDLELSLWDVNEKGKATSLMSFSPEISKAKSKVVSAPRISAANHNVQVHTGGEEITLDKICLARSGDKGNSINLGVIARTKSVYEFIHQYLTPELLKKWFSNICKGDILRYDLENLMALNFVLLEALDGGGTRSGRLDPQGKMLASAFLHKKLYVPKTIIQSVLKP